jgi:hypothetical protein
MFLFHFNTEVVSQSGSVAFIIPKKEKHPKSYLDSWSHQKGISQ